ncbi:MAG: thioredoxin domain-containing protein [Deltaproteobacteria bacterium]|nr:thioredoxin domain-containing protein [Deltaproteobacteria bacterium]
MSNDTQRSSKKATLIYFLFIIALALVGFGLAAELTSIHYNTHQNPEYHSMCAISEGLNCETVALSPYSVFMGLPVSVWGMLGYLVIIVLTGVSLKLSFKETPLFGAVFGFSAVAFLSSAILAWISFTRIDSLCIFCMGTYLLNTLLLALNIALLRKIRKNPIGAIRDDLAFLFGRPLILLFIVSMGAAPLAATYSRIKPYWNTSGFEDIPSLPTGIDTDGDHWIGARNPDVTIIEYTDYECPYCRMAHKQLRELLAKYADRVRVVHRHFPLDQACNPRIRQKFHQYACHFSTAAECAAKDNRFWEMNDAIFSSQDKQKANAIDVEKFAIQLGLDRSEFKQCMTEDSVQETILKDIEAGVKDRVSATPTFVVNNKQYKGRLTEVQLKEILKESD